jgi:hypothetical protein
VVKSRGHDKGTWYAMKTLTKTVILERNHVSMVMKERNLLSRLHCPQLVNMHYAFQDAKNLYIIMDVCLGGDLHYQLTHSTGRCFSEEQAKFYVASIVLCLDYMHSAWRSPRGAAAGVRAPSGGMPGCAPLPPRFPHNRSPAPAPAHSSPPSTQAWASCTATSSRRTCCWTRAGSSR